MSESLDAAVIVRRLRSMQSELRATLRAGMQAAQANVWSRVARDDVGDTIFGIDAMVEDGLLASCRRWGAGQSLVLIAEGLDAAGVRYAPAVETSGQAAAPLRLIVDPIDGTRGLMFDKRSAWCLMAAARDRGAATSLLDVEVAVMTELPTTRQATSDVLWAVRGQGVWCERQNLTDGSSAPVAVVPSGLDTLENGFATVCQFFQGGNQLTGALTEAILRRALGEWNPEKANVFADQYISSGGQLAEIALGRDRFVLDARPLVYRQLGVTSSLCSRPYDLCTMLVAQEAGAVVCDPFGDPIDAPLDTTTNLAFAAYANRRLADRMIPIVRDEVRRLLG